MRFINPHPPPDYRKSADGKYFDYIDGLRFVAVSVVMLYHAGVYPFTGGFIGVDIFFVVSGYLMIGILNRKKYDLPDIIDFYNSRLRRIFPAYIVILYAAAVISVFIYLPMHLKSFGYSLAAAPLFLSNFVFWQQTDYFTPEMGQMPLIHTWSLAVEWQFYLLVPFVFIISRKYGRSCAGLLLALAVLSFAANVYATHHYTTAAFFLLPGRIWEFVAGGVISIGLLPRIKSRFLSEAAAIAGMALIAYSVFSFSGYTTFPGVKALVPCSGTALLIYSSETIGNSITKLLSLRFIRLVGQASYSIYLWHWIIISYVKYVASENSNGNNIFVTLAIVAGSLCCGFLSWKYIELPFRSMKLPLRSAVPLKIAVLASLPVMALGLVYIGANGLPQRYSKAVNDMAAAENDTGHFRACLDTPPSQILAGHVCRLGKTQRNDLLLLGDSHAAALAEGISFQLERVGGGGAYMGTSACAPLFDQIGINLSSRHQCRQQQAIIPALLTQLNPRVVVLHAMWESYYIRGTDIFVKNVDQTFAWLARQPVQVFVIGDVPKARAAVPFALARDMITGSHTFLENKYYRHPVDDVLSAAAKKYGFTFIDLAERLCTNETCPVTLNGTPLYFDDVHLSAFGSHHASQYLPELFDTLP